MNHCYIRDRALDSPRHSGVLLDVFLLSGWLQLEYRCTHHGFTAAARSDQQDGVALSKGSCSPHQVQKLAVR